MPKDNPPKSKPVKHPQDSHLSDQEAERVLEEKKHKAPSGLNWDETTPKPGENFNRATDMGEAD
jgi:hypothetical protein